MVNGLREITMLLKDINGRILVGIIVMVAIPVAIAISELLCVLVLKNILST